MIESIKDIKTVKERLNQHYRIITLDLTTARNNEEFDLEKVVEKYNELKILYAPSAFSFRLNCKDSDLIPIRTNDQTQILGLLFDKIFFTNSVGEGCAIILILSRED